MELWVTGLEGECATQQQSGSQLNNKSGYKCKVILVLILMLKYNKQRLSWAKPKFS